MNLSFAQLALDSELYYSCIYGSKCFRLCVTTLTWTPLGFNNQVLITPGQNLGCDCASFVTILVQDVTTNVAVGPTSFPSPYASVVFSNVNNNQIHATWTLNQNAGVCSAQYCVLSSATTVLGVRPSVCYYGTDAYYVAYYWWAFFVALFLVCCVCKLCVFRRPRGQQEQKPPPTAPPQDEILLAEIVPDVPPSRAAMAIV